MGNEKASRKCQIYIHSLHPSPRNSYVRNWALAMGTTGNQDPGDRNQGIAEESLPHSITQNMINQALVDPDPWK